MLRDPLDDNIIPIVEELQRRLPRVNSVCQAQGEEEEHQGERNEVETSDENGIFI